MAAGERAPQTEPAACQTTPAMTLPTRRAAIALTAERLTERRDFDTHASATASPPGISPWMDAVASTSP
jgi:hypothetical protein